MSFRAAFAAFRVAHALRRRTAAIAINCRLAIHRFDSANSVTTCAVFLANPQKRTFISPNWRLMTRNGCSTLARTLALRCSRLRAVALIGLADRMTRVATIHPALRGVRNLLLSTASRLPFVRRQLAWRLSGLTYRPPASADH